MKKKVKHAVREKHKPRESGWAFVYSLFGNAGFGILLKYPDGSSSGYSDSCGTNCSNYEAEKIAIKTAIQLIHQRFELSESNPTDVIIFSDAKSALKVLQNPPYQDQMTSEIALGISNLIAAHAVHVTLQH